MKSEAKRAQKRNHDYIKDIKLRIFKGKATTFQERNIARIYTKRLKAKRILQLNSENIM